MHHLDEKDRISKEQYEFEMNEDEEYYSHPIDTNNEIPDGIEVD